MTITIKDIQADYEKMKADDRYSQAQKNEKYASLMTVLENYYDLNDADAKALYDELSNARDWSIYE